MTQVRHALISIATVLLCLAPAGTAVAANPHFTRGPTATQDGIDLTITGRLAGLGQGTTSLIEIDADGVATVTCTNPSGKVVPAQTTEFTAFSAVEATPDRNGRYDLNETLSPTLDGNPCPNQRWVAEIAAVHYTSFTVTIDGVLLGTYAV